MIQGYIYILPSLFFMVCFCLLPIFMSTYFSLTDYDIMTKADFIGLENYKKVFSDKYVVDALKNTFIYVIVTVPVQSFLALVFAAFLADKMQNIVGNFLRSAMFIPVIASSVTAGAIWRTIFGTDGGIINTILGLFGVGEINWLGSSKTALICVCVVAIWKNVGYFLVTYYAGIMGLFAGTLRGGKSGRGDFNPVLFQDYHAAFKADQLSGYHSWNHLVLPGI